MKMKKVFLATPMSGFQNAERYAAYRERLLELIAALSEHYEVYSEMQRAPTEEAFSGPETSVREDFHEIEVTDYILFLHPCRMQTSTLIELGYACALKKPAVLVGEPENLPYMALGLRRPTYNAILVDSSEISPETIDKIMAALGELDDKNESTGRVENG